MTNDDNLFLNYMKKNRPKDYLIKEDLLFISHMETVSLGEKKITPKNIERPIPKKNTLSKDSELFIHWVNNSNIISKDKNKKKPHTKAKKLDIPTIDLHGYKREEAKQQLIMFFDSLESNIQKIRIIHGKGLSTGTKSVIKEDVLVFLNYQKNTAGKIKDYSFETPNNGGHGATVVWIY